MIYLSAVKKHLADICDEESKVSDCLVYFRIGAHPETCENNIHVMLETCPMFTAVRSVMHALIVERSLEKALQKFFEVKIVMSH